MQNGVGSGLKGRNTSKKTMGKGGEKRKEIERGEEKKKRKENDGFSTSGFEWSLSFEGGFPKVLKELIPGFRVKKERRQRGSSRVSYKYERCMLFSFLLDIACLCF